MSSWDVVDFTCRKTRGGHYRILQKMMWKTPVEIPDEILSDIDSLRQHLLTEGVIRDSSPVEIEADTKTVSGKIRVAYLYICGMDTGEPMSELFLKY